MRPAGTRRARRDSDGVAVAAWAVLAALAGLAALGVAVAADRGLALCGRRMAMAGSMTDSMPAAHVGVCPIVVGFALAALVLALGAAGMLVARRIGPCTAIRAAAGVVARAGGGLLTAAGVLLAGIPVALLCATQSDVTIAGPSAAGLLIAMFAGAVGAVHVLGAAARALVSLGRRLVVAIVRLLLRLQPARSRPQRFRARHSPSAATLLIARPSAGRAPPLGA